MNYRAGWWVNEIEMEVMGEFGIRPILTENERRARDVEMGHVGECKLGMQ